MEDKIIIEEQEITTCEVFKDEIEKIENDNIRNVTIKVLNDIFKNNIPADIIDHTKQVLRIARAICEARGYTNLALDAITCAALLHDMYKANEIEAIRDFHPFMIRYYHKKEFDLIDAGLAEQICTIIEGHEGYSTILPKVASKEGTIEQILTDANAISKLNF